MIYEYLYKKITNRYARKILLQLIAKHDGGYAYSSHVRTLYSKIHHIQIGYGTYGGCFELNNIPENVSFGNYCSIASGVRIFRANHPLDKFTTHPLLYNPSMGGNVTKDQLVRPPLTIGHDVWIGA